MSAIRLVTEVPGPNSRALLARRHQAVTLALSHTTPIFVERAHGTVVVDVDGNHLLDFAGGIGTLNVGHTHEAVVAAVREQVGKLTHTCFQVAGYEPYVALAEKLNALTPGTFAKKTMLGNSGAEAVENAVKIARRATGREAVVVFEHAFHGRTLLALSMTSKVKPYKAGFGPFAPEIYRLPYPYAYRRSAPLDEATIRTELAEFFATQVAPEKVACVVMELVAGEGGFVVAPPLYVRVLAELCRQHGILFVADEIQSGFGRTGKLFAAEHHGLEPDLMILAKSIAGGLPLSAIVGRAEVMDAAPVGGLGGTYSGNPVACAAALAVLETIEREGLVERAAALGEKLEARLGALAAAIPAIGEARGLGAMRALELVKDRTSREPDKEKTQATIQRAYENGLILIGAGTWGNVLRLLVPLTVSDEELEEGLAVLAHALGH
ncbi:MAG TPA: 4-aminobutyrate--2-oxoglutarate transaminase [Thermoanaerobaculia bacterium]|nr:4-aminobutyrate--2-oxoglutarate transaminase [Thermoanaerobaculia bacterium]